ncbi:hypothetical protein K7G98_22280 [Saccharothrix sp. MB29]|nr:hypothetical protein [Saccharothrix sp. MB29]
MVCLASSAAVVVGMTHHSTPIRGVMASKKDYFEDPEVARLLMEEGVRIHITDSRGSQNIVRVSDPEYDFVMPSGHVVGSRWSRTGVAAPSCRSPVRWWSWASATTWTGSCARRWHNANPISPGCGPVLLPGHGAFVGLSAQGTKWRDLGVRSDNRIGRTRRTRAGPTRARPTSGW